MINENIFKRLFSIIFLFWIIFFAAAQEIPAEDPEEMKQGQVFISWKGFEPDKCASIWLIQRFIDQKAIIKFFPRGEIISEGIPFDVPDAKFRRYAKMSTYESLLHHYSLVDPKLIYIGRIIHDIEINIWERKVMAETISIQASINKIILETKDDNKIIEKGNDFFDILYRELKL